MPFLPSVLVDGEGPGDWPSFLAITPVARHFSILEDDSATVLASLRDLAIALRKIAQAGMLHGDVTPGNVMLVEGPNGRPQLLLTDFHGAAPLGTCGMPTTQLFSALGLSRQELPSLMTDLEAAFHTFIHIAAKEGLLWKHALRYIPICALPCTLLVVFVVRCGLGNARWIVSG